MKKIDKHRFDGKYVIVYGAHLVAVECYRFLVSLELGERVLGFAVTDIKDNPYELEGLPVREIKEYGSHTKDTVVVIAMPLKFHKAVITYLGSFGFEDIETIGLEELSKLKGKRLITSLSGEGFFLKESDNDPTWLDACDDFGKEMFKFPTLFYLDIGLLREKVYQSNPVELWRKRLENVEYVSKLSRCSGKTNGKDALSNIMQIYMAFGQLQIELARKTAYEPWIQPLMVGGSGEMGEFPVDDSYEGNLSNYNSLLAEMTGVHYIWKASRRSEYKGLCHYRRHFILSAEDILAVKANNVDAILTLPRYVPGGIREMFLSETPVKLPVLESIYVTMEKLKTCDRMHFEEYLEECFYFPNNMAVAKADIYDDYCRWIFPILVGMLEEDIKTGYGHENDRHIAYAAELLTSYYFMKKRSGLKLAVADYKFFM